MFITLLCNNCLQLVKRLQHVRRCIIKMQMRQKERECIAFERDVCGELRIVSAEALS